MMFKIKDEGLKGHLWTTTPKGLRINLKKLFFDKTQEKYLCLINMRISTGQTSSI